jgi:spermidine synthase
MNQKLHIEIRKKWWQRELYIDGFPQSGSWYRSIWKKLFVHKMRLRRDKHYKILLLGLGGGDIVKILRKRGILFEADIVELEQEVIDIAKQYFFVVPDDQIRIYAEDAKTYVADNTNHYDLVVVDLYGGDSIPKFVETKEFLTHVATALSPSGQAIFNYASHSFREQDFVSFEKQLQQIFTSVQQQKIWGHTFYLASETSMARLRKSASPGETSS